MKKNFIFLFSFLWFFSSCNFGQNTTHTDISEYLKNVHHLQGNSENPILIVLPVSSCGYCQEKTLEFLLRQHSLARNVHIVIAGYNHADMIPMKQKLSAFATNIILDKGYQYNNFKSLAGNEPFFVYLNEEHEVTKKEINTRNYQLVLSQLLKLLNSQ
jgi:hypothetical protein